MKKPCNRNQLCKLLFTDQKKKKSIAQTAEIPGTDQEQVIKLKENGKQQKFFIIRSSGIAKNDPQHLPS